MSKSSKITASELVLSAIFFLQQKNGVTAKDITKFICEKRGCRQSQVRSEVKRALERATENGIFSKKRGLYRIESGFGRNKISIKVKGSHKAKKMKKVKHSNSARATDATSYTGGLNVPEFSPTVEVPTFSRKGTYSMHPYTDAHAMMLNDGLKDSVKKISVEPTTCAKNAYVDDDDDEDDEEDFFEEDDDEDDIDYFADDQFPSASDAVKEYPPSEHDLDQEEKKKDSCKRKAKSRSKSRTKGKAKRRKLSKPKKKTCKRKRNMVMRKSQKKTREPDSDEEIEQENNDYGEDDDENIEQGSQGDYAREDDEDGQNENDGSEDDNDAEHNHEDYEYDDYPSDEEYLIEQQNKNTKGKERSENKEGVAQLPGEGDQKQKSQGTTDVKVNQSGKAENKQNEIAPTAPATAPQQEDSNQDKKSKPIRSSSLFSSFKKKNESKSSCADRKQIKSRM